MKRFLHPTDVVWEEKWTRENGVQFSCGFCGGNANPSQKLVGAIRDGAGNRPLFGVIRTCPRCGQPSFFREEDGFQSPAPMVGAFISHLPREIETLYNEARECITANSPNACAMVCRKIILHVAADKGFKPSSYGAFQKSVEFVYEQNIMPSGSKEWVDVIRSIGNDANHEIELIDEDLARLALQFTQQMLENVYRSPALAREYRKAIDQRSTPESPQK